MNTDIAIQVTSKTSAGVQLQKPIFLVVLNNKLQFLTIEQPEFSQSYVKVKGVFSNLKKDEICTTYQEVVANIQKHDILEVTFPLNSIAYVQNLVFKAK